MLQGGARTITRLSARTTRQMARAVRRIWNSTPHWVLAIENFRSGAVNLLLLLALIVAIPVGYHLVKRDPITIQDIAVPDTLSDRGFTGSVIAQRIYDEMIAFGQHVRGSIPRNDISPAALDNNLKDIDVLWTGVNAAFILSSVRSFFGMKDRRITGEITIEEEADEEEGKPAKYGLTLRVPGTGMIYRSAKPAERLDPLVREAALEITRRHDPLVASYYYLYARNYDEAYRMTELAISNNQLDMTAAALNLRGLIARARGNWAEAVKQFEEVIKLKPDFVPAYNAYASAVRRVRDAKGNLRLEDSDTMARRALAINPKNSPAYVNLALAARMREDYDSATGLFEKAISVEPNYIPTLVDAGNNSIYLHRYDEAFRYYSRAIDLDPNRPDTYLRLAMARRGQGRLDEAINVVQRGIALDPSLFELQGFHTRLQLMKKDYLRAEASARATIKAFDRVPIGYILLGEALLARGRRGEAEKAAAKAAEMAPNYSEVLLLQGKLLETKGRRAEAIEKYRQAILRGQDERFRLYFIGPLQGDIHIALARALEAAKDSKGAIEAYRGAIKIDPGGYKMHEADIERLSKVAAAKPATPAPSTPPRSPP